MLVWVPQGYYFLQIQSEKKDAILSRSKVEQFLVSNVQFTLLGFLPLPHPQANKGREVTFLEANNLS